MISGILGQFGISANKHSAEDPQERILAPCFCLTKGRFMEGRLGIL